MSCEGDVDLKRVALINPGRDRKFAVQEPLNLGFIASYLEQNGVEATIIDELAGQDVKKELGRFRPDIAGITAVTPLAPDAYRIARKCRDMGILTVMGGVHANIMIEEALEQVDIVVKGEGEIALLDIIRNDVRKGVVTRPYIKNIDDIPPPARHLMQMDFYLRTKQRNPDTYLYFVPRKAKAAAMLTSRGCPYDCIFCHNSWKGTPYRFNSPERVVSEILGLQKDYGVRYIFFIEDNFFANKARVKKICDMIVGQKIDVIWGANARVDGINREILEIAKGAGCRQVTFGFESGSQRILDALNKRTTVEQNRKAIELCNEMGIIPQGTVMVGNPTETIEDVRATQKLLRDSDIKSVGVCITTPFPGTALWDWCKQRGLIPKDFKWSDFDYDRIAIPACDTIPPEVVKQLQLETSAILTDKIPLTFTEVVNRGLKQPKNLVALVRHPSKIKKLVKRLGKKS
jgi:anaerobic magnesium-protoporphyrin IX monomethyl ester cyclase